MGMQQSNLSRFLQSGDVTPAIAAKLEAALDIPAHMWLGLQAQYEADKTAIAARDEKEREAINEEKMLAGILNLSELYARLKLRPEQFVQKKIKAIDELLGFPLLGIGNQTFVQHGFFKKNEKQNVDEKNEATWMTLAYIESRNNKPSGVYTHGNALKAAEEISMFTHAGEITEDKIKGILSQNGISYSVVSKLDKTPIDAASMMVDDYPAIVTTHRYNDMSRLIFNVLHELGHIHKHMSTQDEQKEVFVASDYSRESKEEREANEFAEDMLIPKSVWKKIMASETKGIADKNIIEVLKRKAEEYSLDFEVVLWRYKHESRRYNLYGAKAKNIT